MNEVKSTVSVRRKSIAFWLATSAVLSPVPMAAPASAQNNQAQVEDDVPKEAIVITGSRIARKDYTATSPIVTVDAELLEQSSAINLEANLNKLPQFSPALSQFTTGDIQANANNTIGASTVSLRQLGANRNLVLIDGRRPTPINGAGVVDINSIPSSAVERVEIISGGASSTYGADAVGGVVNFILRRNFEGLSFNSQIGATQRGDGLEYRVSFLAGANIAGGRGNVIFGAERYSRDIIMRKDRPWYQDLFSDPTVTGTEFFLAENYVSFVQGGSPTQACVNALFQGGACGSTTFPGKKVPTSMTLPSGASAALSVSNLSSLYVNPENGSIFVNTSTFLGTGTDRTYVPQLYGYTGPIDGFERKKTVAGLITDNNLDEILSSSQNRWTFFAKARYELNDHINFVGQATFARTQVPSLLLYTVALGVFAVQIPHGSDIYTGNNLLGIASSVGSTISGVSYTNLDYLAKGVVSPAGTGTGRYGLNCPITGGCTMSQTFPTPPELNALLDGRAATGTVTYNGVTYTPRNAPFLVNVTPEQLGRRRTDNNNTTFQVLAGLEGTIPGTDFTWDVTGSHGETVAKTNQAGFLSAFRWKAVLGAPNFGYNFSTVGNLPAPGGGRNGASATCKSGINPFTDVVWTSDCVAAVTIDAQNENRLQQDMVEANLQGGLFDLPYGQLRFAVGADYRKNSIDFTPDSSATEGSSFLETVNGIFPQGHTRGAISVKEAYGELLIPILRDLPFAKALNLELGYRLSDYSSVGTVSTYKINGEYAPFDFLRFRGGYQKASRAPNLGELFTASTQVFTFGNDGDPCSRGNIVSPTGFGNYSANPIGLNGDLQPLATDTFGNADAAKVEALCRQIMGTDAANQYYRAGRVYSTAGGFVTSQLTGNPSLQEETANTYTIGAVITSPFESPWLRRLRIAVDYYNVQLSDGIAQQSVDVVYRFCFSKLYNPTYAFTPECQKVVRDPGTGEPSLLQISYSNLGRVEVDGIDVQADWALTFEDVGLPIPGTFTENIQFSYLNHFKTTTDQNVLALIDYAGTLGGGEVGTNAGSYRWKLFATFGYQIGRYRLSLQWQHKPKVEAAAKATDANSQLTGAKPYDLFNLSGNITVTREAQVRFGVDNLFDVAPPLTGVNRAAVIANGQLPGGSFNASQYDVIGRRFYIGLNYKF